MEALTQREVYKKVAHFRFYEELNDCFPESKRKQTISYHFTGAPSIKDAIEAQGVPHTEVDLILVNGLSVDFNYHLQHEDRVSVYPIFESLDISPVIRLRAAPLRHTAFILDVHLGKLTRLLRLAGFDSTYRNDFEDQEIVTLSLEEKRIILTRDRGLLKIKSVTHGYWIRSIQAEEQLEEVVTRFHLSSQIRPFLRCISCNGLLSKVPKKPIVHLLPPRTARHFQEFSQCADCGKIYWKGSHYSNMKAILQRIVCL